MKNLLIRVDDAITTAEEFFCWIAFFVIFLVLFVAIVFRYAFNSPFTATEEFVTIVFSWVVFLGASTGLRAHALLRVDAFIHLLPLALQRVAAAASLAVMLILLGTLIVYGFDYAAAVRGNVFPMLRLSMAWGAMALPTASCLAVIHILRVTFTEGLTHTFMSVTEVEDAPPART